MSNQTTDQIVTWLRDRADAAGAAGFVVGLSGGIDSAVVAALCQRARNGAVVAALMPCHSNPQDEADAQLVADHFGLKTVRIDLTTAYDSLMPILQRAVTAIPEFAGAASASHDIKARVPAANVKPRLRMTSLYFIANSLNYLVAGTGNRSEIMIGYYTKYGDGGVDLLPIANLLKRDVRAIARELGVPARVIDRPPTAGLWMNQTDEGEMGFTYAELEQYVDGGAAAVSEGTRARIERLVNQSHHKRALPPAPDSAGGHDLG